MDVLEVTEVFIESFDKYAGVFDENYEGGDFCGGLTFGMQGAKLLEKSAQIMFKHHLSHKANEAYNRQN